MPSLNLLLYNSFVAVTDKNFLSEIKIYSPA